MHEIVLAEGGLGTGYLLIKGGRCSPLSHRARRIPVALAAAVTLLDAGRLGAGFRSAAPGSGESRGAALPGTTSRRRHRPTRGAAPRAVLGLVVRAAAPRRRRPP